MWYICSAYVYMFMLDEVYVMELDIWLVYIIVSGDKVTASTQ